MHNFRHFDPTGLGGRLVWKAKKGRTSALTYEELQEQRALQRVETAQERQAEYMGERFRPAFGEDLRRNPRMVARMLGVREDLSHTIPHLIDAGTNAELEAMVQSTPEFQRNKPWAIPGRRFGREMAEILLPERFARRFRSAAQEEVERIWGPGETIEEKRKHMGNSIWNSLNAAERIAVQTELDRLGIAELPQPPGRRRLRRPVAQLANATAEQLREVRAQAGPANDRVFPQPLDTEPPELYANPPSLMDRLIQLRSTEAQKIEELTSTSLFDHQRLQRFLDELRAPDPAATVDQRNKIANMLGGILEEHALAKLKDDPWIRLALKDFEFDYATLSLDEVERRLEEIQQSLPPVETEELGEEETEEGTEEEAKTKEEKKKEDMRSRLGKELAKSRRELEKGYISSIALGSQLHSLLKLEHERTNALSSAGGGRGSVETGLQKLQEQLGKAQENKRELFEKIRTLETEHRRNTKNLHQLLQDSNVPTIPPFIQRFDQADPPELSQEEELFGNYLKHTDDFDHKPGDFARYILENVVETDLLQGGSARKQRLDSIQFCMRWKAERLKAEGAKNEKEVLDQASMMAMADFSRIERVPLDRALARELSEQLGSTGWQTFKKIWTARLTSGTVYTMEDIHEGLTQKGSGLERLNSLSPHMSDNELHVWLDENPEIDTEELATYVEKVKTCLLRFRYDGGSVELLDKDASPLMRFVRRLENVIGVRRVHRAAFAEKLKPGMPIMTQAPQLMKDLAESRTEESKSIFEKLRDKVKSVGRWINRNILGREKKDLIEEIKEKKMSKEEAQREAESRGLLGAAGMGAAITGALDVLEKGSLGKRAMRGAGRAPRSIRRVGGNVLDSLKTGASWTGKGIYYLTAPVWWPTWKLLQGGRWTAGKGWQGTKWFGRKIRDFWNWL